MAGKSSTTKPRIYEGAKFDFYIANQAADMYLDVRAVKLWAIEEAYAAPADGSEPDPLLSEPRYEIVGYDRVTRSNSGGVRMASYHSKEQAKSMLFSLYILISNAQLREFFWEPDEVIAEAKRKAQTETGFATAPNRGDYDDSDLGDPFAE